MRVTVHITWSNVIMNIQMMGYLLAQMKLRSKHTIHLVLFHVILIKRQQVLQTASVSKYITGRKQREKIIVGIGGKRVHMVVIWSDLCAST